ncbi:MAG: CRISPR system precrRNA processing endoribonuclease RAMP protein Cas6 [Wenzhouxiangellaceae bacterium]|nr:CRISPR system precrRNA processing endoribonuclease RAMP protein Cas6 [Wenzhouxiangellaceae bacterium]
MTSTPAFSGIHLSHCRLEFEAERAGHLPDWLGSAWRGMLGHALKQAVCTTGLPECQPCRLVNVCPYPAIYEARPSLEPHILRRYPQAPGPFVLRASPGGEVREGDTLSIEILMFGRHIADLPLVVRALLLAAQGGIGEARIPLRLARMMSVDADGARAPISIDELDQHQPSDLPVAANDAPPRALALEFASPLRLRVQNRYLQPADLRFRDLFSSLLRRYSALATFYGAGEPELNFRGLVQRSEAVTLKRVHLAWHDLARHSSRQRKKIPMGGLVGRVALSGEALAACWPLLWLGQWLHVGKGVNMGLGQYTIHLQ